MENVLWAYGSTLCFCFRRSVALEILFLYSTNNILVFDNARVHFICKFVSPGEFCMSTASVTPN